MTNRFSHPARYPGKHRQPWAFLLCMVLAFASLLPSQRTLAEESVWDSVFDESDHVYFQTSLYTKHFNPKPDHNNDQNLIDLQWHWKSSYLVGLSLFRNSFDQPSEFLYFAKSWDIPHTADLMYFTFAGGFLHGYKGEHKEDIPLNDWGVAPAILPMLGFRYHHIHSTIILFGTAGFTLTLGFDVPLK